MCRFEECPGRAGLVRSLHIIYCSRVNDHVQKKRFVGIFRSVLVSACSSRRDGSGEANSGSRIDQCFAPFASARQHPGTQSVSAVRHPDRPAGTSRSADRDSIFDRSRAGRGPRRGARFLPLGPRIDFPSQRHIPTLRAHVDCRRIKPGPIESHHNFLLDV